MSSTMLLPLANAEFRDCCVRVWPKRSRFQVGLWVRMQVSWLPSRTVPHHNSSQGGRDVAWNRSGKSIELPGLSSQISLWISFYPVLAHWGLLLISAAFHPFSRQEGEVSSAGPNSLTPTCPWADPSPPFPCGSDPPERGTRFPVIPQLLWTELFWSS